MLEMLLAHGVTVSADDLAWAISHGWPLAVSRYLKEVDHHGLDTHPEIGRSIRHAITHGDQAVLNIMADAVDIKAHRQALAQGFKNPNARRLWEELH